MSNLHNRASRTLTPRLAAQYPSTPYPCYQDFDGFEGGGYCNTDTAPPADNGSSDDGTTGTDAGDGGYDNGTGPSSGQSCSDGTCTGYYGDGGSG